MGWDLSPAVTWYFFFDTSWCFFYRIVSWYRLRDERVYVTGRYRRRHIWSFGVILALFKEVYEYFWLFWEIYKQIHFDECFSTQKGAFGEVNSIVPAMAELYKSKGMESKSRALKVKKYGKCWWSHTCLKLQDWIVGWWSSSWHQCYRLGEIRFGSSEDRGSDFFGHCQILGGPQLLLLTTRAKAVTCSRRFWVKSQKPWSSRQHQIMEALLNSTFFQLQLNDSLRNDAKFSWILEPPFSWYP